MDGPEIQAPFTDVFDQAIVFHDYDVFVYATADPRTGIVPEHLRVKWQTLTLA